MTSADLLETINNPRLDPFTPFRMDRRARAARAANADRGGNATAPWPRPGQDAERTSHPCPPYPHSTLANPGELCSQATASSEAGRP
ncbi:hypothetical protein Asi03nite_22180 [Actinoplanes siamensis]|uniref:Uncharacterized protein n=1 Tax=Actinoplanes siamensis TaxID=1223317 RepID=A0A919N5D2_9ACTN|nr:hypothetical protein Asi03nite_22180 [Actinoplanes siamensis]